MNTLISKFENYPRLVFEIFSLIIGWFIRQSEEPLIYEVFWKPRIAEKSKTCFGKWPAENKSRKRSTEKTNWSNETIFRRSFRTGFEIFAMFRLGTSEMVTPWYNFARLPFGEQLVTGQGWWAHELLRFKSSDFEGSFRIVPTCDQHLLRKQLIKPV